MRVLFFVLIICGMISRGAEARSLENEELLKGGILETDSNLQTLQNKHLPYWYDDYQAALKKSKETGKTLLIAFTGLDWCPWSQKMHNDILTKGEFSKSLSEDLILVRVDFPEHLDLLALANADLELLKETYKVSEFPTLMLVEPSGQEIYRLGYMPLPPQEFSQQIKKIVSEYRDLKQSMNSLDLMTSKQEVLEDLYNKASKLKCTKFKEQILDAGLKVGQGPFFLLEKYSAITEKNKKDEVQKLRHDIVASDPLNSKGSHLQLAILDFQNLSLKLQKKENTDVAIAPLVQYIKTFGKKDPENVWKVEMMISQFLFSKNKIEPAIAHAEESLKSAPESAKPEIAQSIAYLKTCLTK